MRSVIYLVRRNIALFINNSLNILLSFATIPIVICLYIFFLRDFLVDFIMTMGVDELHVYEFTDNMIFAGLLVVINTTTCFGVIQIYVNDYASGIRRDFLTAPVGLFSVTLGYWITSILVSSFYTYLTVLGGELFFKYKYGNIMTVWALLRMLIIILASACINSGLLLCFSRNLKNTTTFSTFANLYGTVIGFLAGDYLPYCFYSDWLKKVLLWFPPTQLTSILRREYIHKIEESAKIFSDNRTLHVLYENFGISLNYKGGILTVNQQWSILILSLAALLLYLWICCYERKKKLVM